MLNKSSLLLLSATALLISLTACQRTDETGKGPAEQVGAKIDAAGVKAGAAIDKVGVEAGKELQSAGVQAGEAMKKSGEKLEQASKDLPKKE